LGAVVEASDRGDAATSSRSPISAPHSTLSGHPRPDRTLYPVTHPDATAMPTADTSSSPASSPSSSRIEICQAGRHQERPSTATHVLAFLDARRRFARKGAHTGVRASSSRLRACASPLCSRSIDDGRSRGVRSLHAGRADERNLFDVEQEGRPRAEGRGDHCPAAPTASTPSIE
jgi:hypothetical protein